LPKIYCWRLIVSRIEILETLHYGQFFFYLNQCFHRTTATDTRHFFGQRRHLKSSERSKIHFSLLQQFLLLSASIYHYCISKMVTVYLIQFLSGCRRVQFLNDPNFGFVYSKHPNTEPSGIRMVTFRTLFGSSYQMVRILNVRDRTYLSGYFFG
jgi:hypothetical protein